MQIARWRCAYRAYNGHEFVGRISEAPSGNTMPQESLCSINRPEP
ncbi:hypothetical protein HMPREF9538_03556 [Klebsiella sp. MS 92-3]|nr:hypothetical protein HMPREF9538_03556 [Klebsiella sp. MS 92-3]